MHAVECQANQCKTLWRVVEGQGLGVFQAMHYKSLVN